MDTPISKLTDKELLDQTSDQYRAVCHMLESIKTVYSEVTPILDLGSRGVLEIQCAHSASLMEMLGETLNGMDAVDDDEDGWMTPIFEKAHELFPTA